MTYGRCEVLKAVLLNIRVFLDVTLCSLVNNYPLTTLRQYTQRHVHEDLYLRM
jgi:hypothetical protein